MPVEIRAGIAGRSGAALAAVLTVTLAGCVTMPTDRQPVDEPWVPATAESLQSWSERYDQVLAGANEQRNPAALESIEIGMLRQVDQTAYTLAERIDPEGGELLQPFTHNDPTFFLPSPETDDYPLWMVVHSTHSETGADIVDWAARPSAAGDWRKQLSITLDDGQEFPALVTDDAGAPTFVHPENAEGLRRTPNTIARAFAAYLLEADPASDYGKPFPDHPELDAQIERNIGDAEGVEEGVVELDHETELTPVRALEAEDGGVLMIFGVTERRELRLDSGQLDLEADNPVAVYTGQETVTESMQLATAWQLAMYVHPEGTGEPGDPDVDLLGVRYDLLDAAVR